jgi:hypothetical protein
MAQIYIWSLRSARLCRLPPKGRKNMEAKMVIKNINKNTERFKKMISFILLEELVKARFQHSSSNIKPLFSRE